MQTVRWSARYGGLRRTAMMSLSVLIEDGVCLTEQPWCCVQSCVDELRELPTAFHSAGDKQRPHTLLWDMTRSISPAPDR